MDISNGYKSVQSCHSVADFASNYPGKFLKWKQESNSIICLSVRDENELKDLYQKLKFDTESVIFWEPDLNAYTSICLYGSPEIRRRLKYLTLLK